MLSQETYVKPDRSMVYILDDDARVREALIALLSSTGYRVTAFASAREYLAYTRPDVPGCLVLDLAMPGMSGLDLQRELAGKDGPPIVFLTGHGDIPSTVKAMKGGAVEFLAKPFDEGALIAAIDSAIKEDEQARETHAELESLRKRYLSLTPREREVLPFVVRGFLNKQTAGELGTSEITIRIHRGQIMRKMKADSLADLVRIAAKLGIP
jgi:FixJ family two-component response regulator